MIGSPIEYIQGSCYYDMSVLLEMEELTGDRLGVERSIAGPVIYKFKLIGLSIRVLDHPRRVLLLS